MDELFQRIHAATGLSTDTAAKAVEIILNFLRKEGPEGSVDQLVERLPGAESLIRAHGEEGNPGLLGGVAGGLAGLMAGGEGVMAAFNDLTSAGLDMEQIQATVEEFVAFAREKAGDQVVDDIISDIPALARMT